MRRWIACCGVVLWTACGRGVEAHAVQPPCGPTPTEAAGAPPSVETLARDAAALVAPDEDGRRPVLVTFRKGQGVHAAAVLDAVGGRLVRSLPAFGMAALRVTPEERARLEASPLVAHVEEDRPLFAANLLPLASRALLGATTPPLPVVTSEVPWGVAAVQAPEVWDADADGVPDEGRPTGKGVRVCVVDSGIARTHPELQGAYVGGYDFLDQDDDPDDSSAGPDHTRIPGTGHGSHVAGIIAARLGSGGTVIPGMAPGGVVGVAPEVELLVARVLGVRGSGATSTALAALAWCAKNGAKIVSLSLGSPAPSEAERSAIATAVQAGMLVVAASGNGAPETEGISYPAAYPGVLSVGAVDANLRVAAFSQRGEGLGLVAPGVDVLSLALPGQGAFSEVQVGSTSMRSNPLQYTARGAYTGRVVDCGTGDDYSSCGEAASCDGFVAFVRRGGLTFSKKASNVMGQGARAIVFGNDAEDGSLGHFTLGGPRTDEPWVPAASLSLADAQVVQGLVGSESTVRVESADYVSMDGTSMATPHVSAAAALVWAYRPDLTARQVRELLKSTARDLGEPGLDTTYGAGLVQVRAALERLDAGPLPPEWSSP